MMGVLMSLSSSAAAGPVGVRGMGDTFRLLGVLFAEAVDLSGGVVQPRV